MSFHARRLVTSATTAYVRARWHSSVSGSKAAGDYATLLKTGLATGLIAASLFAYYGFQELSSIELGTGSSDDSTSFQVMAALEMKDEVQKVRLAQILHELHELASEQGQVLKKRSTAQWMLNASSQMFPAKAPPVSADGMISLKKINLSKLTLKKAQTLIDALLDNGRFDNDCLLTLLGAAESALKKDPTLVDLRGVQNKIAVVGDLHGSLNSLSNVLEMLGDIGGIGGPNGNKVIFDGDFVDRGSESLEVLCILLLLKLAYPHDVYLLRGNHEDVLVSAAYGFQEEVLSKYGRDNSQPIWSEFSHVFSALPIGAVTKTAAILHGGLPSDRFNLRDLETIDSERRCKIRTTIDTKDEVDVMVRNILWSDPTTKNGIHPNTTRSVGVQFGPDVSRDFLERHKLKYLIRAHEVVEEGTSVLECGGGRSVVTVFSHAAYPNGKGTNLGAIVQLDKDGGCDTTEFSSEAPHHHEGQENHDPFVDALHSLIAKNKNKLEQSFRAAAKDRKKAYVTASQWERIMADTLELPDAPWNVLRTSLAPGGCKPGANRINWRDFLSMYSSPVDSSKDCSVDSVNMEILHANHEMLVTVYKFLDVDGDGTLDMHEFKKGIDLLNKRLPKDMKLGDPEALFRTIDKDGSGTIDVQEFERAFSLM